MVPVGAMTTFCVFVSRSAVSGSSWCYDHSCSLCFQECRKWFPWTFAGSISFIAGYSFLMNWWAAIISETANIPEAVSNKITSGKHKT